jgi:cytochrome b subunit of formate dehydrogenase
MIAGTFLFAGAWEEEPCADCHEDVALDGSVHEGLDCIDCHAALPDLDWDHSEGYSTDYPTVNRACGDCHEGEFEEYLTSVHSLSLLKPKADEEAAFCHSCHGSHNILPADDPASLVYPLNLAGTCGTCHAKPELVAKYKIPDLRPVELFSRSYHAKRLYEDQDLLAATCNDCHGIHDIKISTDPTSTISHANIARTCGSCHREIFNRYQRSVHWEALIRGERESPVCVDCHGEHEILAQRREVAGVTKRIMAERTCTRCHTDQRLVEKYGLAAGKVSTYQDSYHGLAVMQGDDRAAACFDCHNAHEVLPAADPRSSIYVDSLWETCARCHPGATAAFARSYTHKSVILAERPVEYYVKLVYLTLIAVIIGGMLLHNGLIMVGHVVRKYRHEREADYFQRYPRAEIWQHLVLIVAFFTLVITGFALKFPEMFWVKGLATIGLTEAIRGWVHRIAAVILMGLGAWHFVRIVSTGQGREFIRSLFPTRADWRDFLRLVRSTLSRAAKGPEFDRFDYTEKLEYWALMWGTVIMILTGIILWFPTYFGKFSPAWLIKVAETIHYYEAWLATLAIFVWHFFFVIFHPREYPLSMTWLHGRMSLEEYRVRHPRDYARIMAEIEAFRQGEKAAKDLSYTAREYIRRHGIKSSA